MKTVKGHDILGYTIGAYNTPIALLDRHTNYCTYVVAWSFDDNDGTWGQGHYFEELEEAREYFKTYMA